MIKLSQNFAPPFKLVAPFFIIGVTFYLLSSLFTFVINIDLLNFHNSEILAYVHMLLLGFIMMIIFGAMAQLIPVTLEVGHFSIEFYYIIYPLLLIGTVLMFYGFSISPQFISFGGIFVFISMIIYLVELFLTIKKVEKFTNITKSLIVSNLFLLIGIIFGIIMALTYAGVFEIDVQKLLKAHVFSVVFGYIVITIMALSLILLPMFGLSHNFSLKPINISVVILTVAIITNIIFSIFDISILIYISYLLIIIALIIYFYQIYLIYKTRARKENDIYVKALYFSFTSFLLSITLALIYFITNYKGCIYSSVWLFINGFITYIIIAHLYKIVPFLVWFEKFAPLVGKQKVPMLVDMIPIKSSSFQFIFGLIGVTISTLGLIFLQDDIFKAGISFITISAIFLLKNLIFMIRFK